MSEYPENVFLTVNDWTFYYLSLALHRLVKALEAEGLVARSRRRPASASGRACCRSPAPTASGWWPRFTRRMERKLAG